MSTERTKIEAEKESGGGAQTGSRVSRHSHRNTGARPVSRSGLVQDKSC